MRIKLYDRVLLKCGCEASIVEIFEEGKCFLADIDRNGDTYTDEISVKDIKMVISTVFTEKLLKTK